MSGVFWGRLFLSRRPQISLRFKLCALPIDAPFTETTTYLDRIAFYCSNKLGKIVDSWNPEATLATVGTATLN